MYKKRNYTPRYKKVRYSNETTCLNISSQVTGGQTPTIPVYSDGALGFVLVKAADLQGTRKVKNMLLSISSYGNQVPLLCAIVYVPQGTSPSNITPSNVANRTGSSLYEPNQNVIMQFVMNPIDPTSGAGSDVQNFKTRLARNLDSGDSIMLVMCPAYPTAQGTDQTIRVAGTFNYAISY